MSSTFWIAHLSQNDQRDRRRGAPCAVATDQLRPKTVKRLPAGISTSGETLSRTGPVHLWNSLLIDSRLLGCDAQRGILYASGEPGQGRRKCT
jgi:hypothetical protein